MPTKYTTTGKEILAGAADALAIATGEADPSAYRVREPKEINIRALRERLGMTQAAFAGRFGFAVSAVRDWEYGRRRPDRSARVLLMVIEQNPGAVDSALDAYSAA